MEKEIREYLQENEEKDKTLKEQACFQWTIAVQYGTQYQKYIQQELDVSQEEIECGRELVLKYIPEELVGYLELFCQLDKEYKQFAEQINAKRSKDGPKIGYPQRLPVHEWRGFWLGATGNDFSLLINWIGSAIKYKKYRDKGIVFSCMECHKENEEVPYSVKMAEYIYRKYYTEYFTMV